MKQTRPIPDEIKRKIESMENDIAKMKLTDKPRTLVIGGLAQYTLEAAKSWLSKGLSDCGAVLPIDMYKKGRPDEPFKGVMIMKFGAPEHAERAMAAVQDKCTKENQQSGAQPGAANRLWCNFEETIEQRVSISFLFALRRELITWNYAAKSITIDTDKQVMKVQKKEVLKVVGVMGDEVKDEWLDASWAQWSQLQQSPELNKIREEASGKLARSRAETSKGAGKGPHQ